MAPEASTSERIAADMLHADLRRAIHDLEASPVDDVCAAHASIAQGVLVLLRIEQARMAGRASADAPAESCIEWGALKIRGRIAVGVYRAAMVIAAVYGLAVLHGRAPLPGVLP
jgi:hypothetical protein